MGTDGICFCKVAALQRGWSQILPLETEVSASYTVRTILPKSVTDTLIHELQ